MPNTRTLNSFVLNNSLKVNETTTIVDPTMVGPLPGVAGLGNQYNLNGTSTPPVGYTWHNQVVLVPGSSSSSGSSPSSSSSGGGVSGSYLMDLMNLPDPVLGSVSGNGNPVTVMHWDAMRTNKGPIIVQPGTGNGYSGWGLGLILYPGDIDNLMKNGTPNVSSTSRYLLLTGTAGDAIDVCIAFG